MTKINKSEYHFKPIAYSNKLQKHLLERIFWNPSCSRKSPKPNNYHKNSANKEARSGTNWRWCSTRGIHVLQLRWIATLESIYDLLKVFFHRHYLFTIYLSIYYILLLDYWTISLELSMNVVFVFYSSYTSSIYTYICCTSTGDVVILL